MEIERKFLVKDIPGLLGYGVEEYERYFVFTGNGVEIRVQRINQKYQWERKLEVSKLGRDEFKLDITKDEFEYFKSISKKAILRTSYVIQEDPEISIKIYKGEYEGLVRAEFEFASEEEARLFVPPVWCGKEITESPLGRDKKLVELSREDYLMLMV